MNLTTSTKASATASRLAFSSHSTEWHEAPQSRNRSISVADKGVRMQRYISLAVFEMAGGSLLAMHRACKKQQLAQNSAS